MPPMLALCANMNELLLARLISHNFPTSLILEQEHAAEAV